MIVSGKVQRVSFRVYTQAQAEQLGVVGYVQNLINGDVKIVVAGEDAKVDALINWAKSGSPSAKVESLQAIAMEYQEDEFTCFEVKYLSKINYIAIAIIFQNLLYIIS